MNQQLSKIFAIMKWVLANPRLASREMQRAMVADRAYSFGGRWENRPLDSFSGTGDAGVNPLTQYFENHKEGNGIWKWRHYFDMYHKHFEKFRGQEVHIVEVGVYSGGSMDMWKNYLGPGCKVYGVDIQQECKLYEKDDIRIFIGDQADRNFWKQFREQVPRIDILIDDGGHQPEQQIVTLEETLPFISPGGVFICEDVHRAEHPFSDYMNALHKLLNHQNFTTRTPLTSLSNTWQQSIHAIHHYPFAYVIEKNYHEAIELVAPRHGTKWEPFL